MEDGWEDFLWLAKKDRLTTFALPLVYTKEERVRGHGVSLLNLPTKEIMYFIPEIRVCGNGYNTIEFFSKGTEKTLFVHARTQPYFFFRSC
eukprot:CFRG6253T1